MLLSNLPAKFGIPFANNAGASYIRSIPQASQQGIGNGAAASLYDGFPPICFIPTTANGVPPAGQDINGILYQITAWNRWQAAGGTVLFDSTFSSAIGGYPLNAVVASTTTGKLWLNTVDGNTTNPDAGGAAGWILIYTANFNGGGSTGGYVGGTTNNLFIAKKSADQGLSQSAATDISWQTYNNPAFGSFNGTTVTIGTGQGGRYWAQAGTVVFTALSGGGYVSGAILMVVNGTQVQGDQRWGNAPYSGTFNSDCKDGRWLDLADGATIKIQSQSSGDAWAGANVKQAVGTYFVLIKTT